MKTIKFLSLSAAFGGLLLATGCATTTRIDNPGSDPESGIRSEGTIGSEELRQVAVAAVHDGVHMLVAEVRHRIPETDIGMRAPELRRAKLRFVVTPHMRIGYDTEDEPCGTARRPPRRHGEKTPSAQESKPH